MKIDIEIEDVSLFTHLALVIDRLKIRETIIQVRNKWTKGKIYLTVSEWKSTHKIHTYQNDIIDLIAENEISPVFAPVFEETIFTGKVTRFSQVLSIPIPRRDLAELYFAKDDTITTEDYEYTLITPMEASSSEVVRQYNEVKRTVKKDKQREEPEDLTGYYELVQPVSDTKSEVRTHRDWYWMHLPLGEGGNDLSNFQIAISVIDKLYSNEDELFIGGGATC